MHRVACTTWHLLCSLGVCVAVEYTAFQQGDRITKTDPMSFYVSQNWSNWIVGRAKSYASNAILSRSSDGKVWTDFAIPGFTDKQKYWQDSEMTPDGKYIGVCKPDKAFVSSNSGANWTRPQGQEHPHHNPNPMTLHVTLTPTKVTLCDTTIQIKIFHLLNGSMGPPQ
jgi:hypothetical protein